MALAKSAPQKSAPAPAKAEATPSPAAAGPAAANSEAQDALSTAEAPYTQAMDQLRQGIPDPAALLGFLQGCSPAELAGIAKNQGYLDQIEARAGKDLLPKFHEVLGTAQDAAAEEAHPKLKPDQTLIPGFLQKDVTNAVTAGWREWRKLTNLALQAHFLDKLDEDVAAAKATGKNQLQGLQGPHLPKPPDLGTILGSFGEWMFSAFEGPRHQDVDYNVDVRGDNPLATPVLIGFTGLIQYEFYSAALGGGVELTVSAPSNKSVKLLPGGLVAGLETINVDAVRPRVQAMSPKGS